LPLHKKIAPFLSARIGGSFYNQRFQHGSIKGGLFMEYKVGFAAGKGRTKFLMGAGYTNAAFNYQTTFGQTMVQKLWQKGWSSASALK